MRRPRRSSVLVGIVALALLQTGCANEKERRLPGIYGEAQTERGPVERRFPQLGTFVRTS